MTVTAEPQAPATLYWSGPLVIEGVPTGDGRRVMAGALTWRDLPLPLMFQSTTPEGNGNPHAGAMLAGRITTLWRDDATIYGAGTIDTGEGGANLARFLEDGPIGISADMDNATVEVVCLEEDEFGECLDGELQIQEARIMGGTSTPFPAIPDAKIGLVTAAEYATLVTEHTEQLAVDDVEPHEFEDSGDGTCTVCGKTEADHAAMSVTALHFNEATNLSDPEWARHAAPFVAAAARLLPPETWFEDPGFHELTPFTILDADEHGNRRCYGHLAKWGQPHIALAGRTPPKSGSGYAYFQTGAIRAACECPDLGGQVEIPVGTYTMGTGHYMDLRAGAAEAIAHYDNTGLAAAYLAAGEDEFGIWGAGVVAPSLAEERVVELRAAAPSGDWRFIGGRLEMVAVLGVNTPGFPVVRESFHTSEGRETALVAAGIVPPRRVVSYSEHAALESRLAILEARLSQQSGRLRVLEPMMLGALAARFHE